MNIQAFIGFGFTLSVVENHVDQVGLRADMSGADWLGEPNQVADE
jgi:hypothetical protein